MGTLKRTFTEGKNAKATEITFEGTSFGIKALKKHIQTEKAFIDHYKRSTFGKVIDGKFVADADQEQKLKAAYEFFTESKPGK